MSYPAPVTDATDLYSQIQLFYGQQMQLLDTGATDEWAATFTEDGVFAANGLPEPVRGRTAIAAAARRAADQLAEAALEHRHWLGMLSLRPDSGTVFARSYALVIEIPRGGSATIHRSTVCEDLLVPDGNSWLVHRRDVTRDDLA
jgi:hypothetical protein